MDSSKLAGSLGTEKAMVVSAPILSFLYYTNRPGGIDILAQSLQLQPPYTYELILIDDYPGRVERGVALQYLKDRGIPVRYYGPSKLGDLPYPAGPARALNAGIARCKTDYLVMSSDYTWFGPGTFSQWFSSKCQHPKNAIISGVGSVRFSNPPFNEDDVTLWGGYTDFTHNIFNEKVDNVPNIFELFFWGAPVEFLESINGISEESPYWNSVVFQAMYHQYHVVIDKRLRFDMLEHRNWNGDMWRSPPMDHGREVGVVSRNPFNLKELRAKYLKEMDGK